jgi:hypothetical protein
VVGVVAERDVERTRRLPRGVDAAGPADVERLGPAPRVARRGRLRAERPGPERRRALAGRVVEQRQDSTSPRQRVARRDRCATHASHGDRATPPSPRRRHVSPRSLAVTSPGAHGPPGISMDSTSAAARDLVVPRLQRHATSMTRRLP